MKGAAYILGTSAIDIVCLTSQAYDSSEQPCIFKNSRIPSKYRQTKKMCLKLVSLITLKTFSSNSFYHFILKGRYSPACQTFTACVPESVRRSMEGAMRGRGRR